MWRSSWLLTGNRSKNRKGHSRLQQRWCSFCTGNSMGRSSFPLDKWINICSTIQGRNRAFKHQYEYLKITSREKQPLKIVFHPLPLEISHSFVLNCQHRIAANLNYCAKQSMHLEIRFTWSNLLNYTEHEKAHLSCQKVMQPGTMPSFERCLFERKGQELAALRSPPSSFCSMKEPEIRCLGNQIPERKNERTLHFIKAAEPSHWLQTLVDP